MQPPKPQPPGRELSILLLLIFAIFIPTSAYGTSPSQLAPVIANVSPSYSEFSFSPSKLIIFMPPNEVDGFIITARAERGNLPIHLILTLEESFLNFSYVYPHYFLLDVLEERNFTFHLDTWGVEVGNYSGYILGKVEETNYTSLLPINLTVSTDVGRFLIQVTDEAYKPLPNASISIYRGLELIETGITDEHGFYRTHFYPLETYYAIVVGKEGYSSKATGKRLVNYTTFVQIVLGGTPFLAFSPNYVFLVMDLNQTKTITLRLENWGNGKERWIDILPNQKWIKVQPTYLEFLEPGGFREITVTVGPFFKEGIYLGEIKAYGFRSTASAIIQVQVSPPPPPPIVKFPAVDVEYPRTLELTRGVSRLIFVKVKNVGEVDLHNLTLEAYGEGLLVEIYPSAYLLCPMGDSKIFIMRILPQEEGVGNLTLKIVSREIETYRQINYEIKISPVDPEVLRGEIEALRQILRVLERELTSLGEQGFSVTGAFSFLSAVDQKLANAELSLKFGRLFEAKGWIDEATRDISDLISVIDRVRAIPPPRIGLEIWFILILLVILIILLLLLLLIWRRRKRER